MSLPSTWPCCLPLLGLVSGWSDGYTRREFRLPPLRLGVWVVSRVIPHLGGRGSRLTLRVSSTGREVDHRLQLPPAWEPVPAQWYLLKGASVEEICWASSVIDLWSGASWRRVKRETNRPPSSTPSYRDLYHPSPAQKLRSYIKQVFFWKHNTKC